MNRFFVSSAAALASLAIMAPSFAHGTETDQVTPRHEICQGEHWVTAWTTAMDNNERPFGGNSMRMPLRMMASGDTIRISLSNELTSTETTLTGITVAKRDGNGPGIVTDTEIPVTFGATNTVTMAPFTEATSDPLHFPVEQFDDLMVTFYSVESNGNATGHQWAQQTSYVGYGEDSSGKPEAEKSWTPSESSFWYVSRVDVMAAENVGNVVLFGDSITEGFNSTADAHSRYPDHVARSIADAGLELVVANEGLSGNRVTHDGHELIGGGLNAVDRFARDVGSVADPIAVVVLVGINDLGHPGIITHGDEERTAQEIIDGLADIAEQARAMGLKVYGGTLTPAGDLLQPSPLGPNYSKPQSNAKRNEINGWVRHSGTFDAVFDFDRALADPIFPEHLWIEYNSGDSLHPNDAGYAAMADTVALDQFPTRDCTDVLAKGKGRGQVDGLGIGHSESNGNGYGHVKAIGAGHRNDG